MSVSVCSSMGQHCVATDLVRLTFFPVETRENE